MNSPAVTVILFLLVVASGGLAIYSAMDSGMSVPDFGKMFNSGKSDKPTLRLITFRVGRDFRDKRIGVVELQFENYGRKTVQYPTLRFSLKSEANKKLQESKLRPIQYLHKSVPIEKGMEPGKIVAYTFRFEIPTKELPKVGLKFE